MKIKKISPYNYVPSKGEVNDMPSATIPGRSFTIEEMLKRVGQGQRVPIDRNQQWQESEELMPVLKDLTDIDRAKAYIDEIKAKIKDLSKEQKKKTQEEKPLTEDVEKDDKE